MEDPAVTHLLFVDGDIQFDANSVVRMMRRVSQRSLWWLLLQLQLAPRGAEGLRGKEVNAAQGVLRCASCHTLALPLRRTPQ